jgi:hypothetical protein
MSDGTEQRKLAATMFTDMVGYSALSQRDGKLALELLEEHRALLREIETGLRAPNASLLSYGALKLLPFWDPLRGDPRFEKIVAALAPKDTSK